MDVVLYQVYRDNIEVSSINPGDDGADHEIHLFLFQNRHELFAVTKYLCDNPSLPICSKDEETPSFCQIFTFLTSSNIHLKSAKAFLPEYPSADLSL